MYRLLPGGVGEAVLELSGVLGWEEVSEEVFREPGMRFSAWKFGGKKKSLLAGSERFLGDPLGDGVRLALLG